MRLPIRSSGLICPGEVLTVVHGEIQMVQSMMGGSVDDVLQPMAGDHVRIVNEHRPDVHAHEEDKMEVLLNREEVRKDVIGEGLEVTVEWVECVGCEWGGYDPFVVRLV